MPHKTQPLPLRCIDLFAGCGGLSLGLEQAGFLPVFVNELNADARESYLVNREVKNPLLRQKFHSADVKDLVLDESLRTDLIEGLKQHWGLNSKRGDLDLLTGGPPCQGFSGIGHRRSYSVDRRQLPSNHLYQDMAFLISALRPKIFLFENVKGLLSARWTKGGEKGEIWKSVRQTFNGLNEYEVRFELVYAKEYGVPQNRPRVLLVGLRRDLDFPNIDPTCSGAVESGFLPGGSGEPPEIEDLLGDLVDPNFQNGGTTRFYPSKASGKVQRLLRVDPESGTIKAKGTLVTEQTYSKHSPHIVEKFEHMIATGGEIPSHLRTKKFAQRLLPARWGDDGPTITATSLPDDYVHFSQPRSLTVREWARLQMFPDWYQFAGKRTTGGVRRAGNPLEGLHDREVPKYTQIGNAVPVELARQVGVHFAQLLREV